jgi:hypothetical protein
MGDIRNAYKTSVGKSEGKVSFGIPRRKQDGNIKMYLKQRLTIRTAFIWLVVMASGGLL